MLWLALPQSSPGDQCTDAWSRPCALPIAQLVAMMLFHHLELKRDHILNDAALPPHVFVIAATLWCPIHEHQQSLLLYCVLPGISKTSSFTCC